MLGNVCSCVCVDCCLLFAFLWLVAVYGLLFVVCSVLFVLRFFSFCCLLCVVRRFVARCLLFVVCCSLVAVCSFAFLFVARL